MVKQSLDSDGLGDKHKALEQISAGQRLIPHVPVIARIDGRAFHTLLRNADKPFDEDVVEAMQTTAKTLLDHFGASIAYTQSDEITLVWDPLDMFDGKIQKIVSTSASMAGVVFYKKMKDVMFSESGANFDGGAIPAFDCRVWQVPDLETAAENILWREMDATKNSISMLASAHFHHNKLIGISTKERLVMLEAKGIIWGELPSHLKRGSYFRKVKRSKLLSEEELSKIPEEYRPIDAVQRSIIEMQYYPPATTISNFADVLFRGREPILYGEKDESNT